MITCPTPQFVSFPDQSVVVLFSAHLTSLDLRYTVQNGGNFVVFLRCTRVTTGCVVETVKAGVGVRVWYM